MKLNLSLITISLLIAFTLFSQNLHSQNTSAHLGFRINPVYSRGFREPLYNDEEAGFFTMQRTRLTLNYINPDSLSAEVVLQDRRAWGETGENQDISEVAIFRAWVEPQISDHLSIRIGRQGFVYDDQHLLAERNWGGALAHNGVITKFKKKSFETHLGLAFNSNRVNELKREPYEANFYKNMQFLWVHKQSSKLKASFILINRGTEASDTTVQYTQTFGTNSTFKLSNNVSIKGIYYQQMGKTLTKRNLNATFWSTQLIWSPVSKVNLTFGIESASGTDVDRYNQDPTQSSSFDIMYGMLHGYFGHMDYFYVLIDPVFGVKDSYAKIKYDFNKKWKLRNDIHLFNTSATAFLPSDTSFENPLDPYLGVENNFSIKYTHNKLTTFTLGHAIMFGTETLDAMFGGEPSRDNQLFYLVITAKPKLL